MLNFFLEYAGWPMRVHFGRSRDDRCDLYPKTGCKTHHPANAHQQKNISSSSLSSPPPTRAIATSLSSILDPTSLSIRYLPVLECSSCKTISEDHVQTSTLEMSCSKGQLCPSPTISFKRTRPQGHQINCNRHKISLSTQRTRDRRSE